MHFLFHKLTIVFLCILCLAQVLTATKRRLSSPSKGWCHGRKCYRTAYRSVYYPCYTACMTLTIDHVGFYSDRPERGVPCRFLKLRCEWGLKEDQRMGSFLGWFFGLVVLVQEILVLPGCSSRPSKKYFFITAHYFHSFVPIAQQAGQAAVLCRRSLSVCLWFYSIFVGCVKW